MARNVFGILDDISASVSDLKSALAPLAALAGGADPILRRRRPQKKLKHSGERALRRKAAPAAASANAVSRRKPVSAAVKAKRVLQGRYLAAIRPLSKAQRAKVKKIQATKGHEAAIRYAVTVG